MVDEKTSLLSSGGSKDDNNGATRRRSKLGSFSRFGGEFFVSQKNDIFFSCDVYLLLSLAN